MTLQSLIEAFTDLIKSQLLPIFFGLGVAVFFYGIARYIWNAGGKEDKQVGKHIITWGIVVMFIMSAIWGIISFLQGDFGIENTNLTPTSGESPFE